MLLKYVSLFEKNVAVWSIVLFTLGGFIVLAIFFFILMLSNRFQLNIFPILVHYFGETVYLTVLILLGVYLSDWTYSTMLLFC